MSQPEVSWKAIEHGAHVYGVDGEEIGTVDEIAGDAEADIFSGLVISSSLFSARRFLPAERVTGIWSDRVETTLTSSQADTLDKYEEPVTERWEPPESAWSRIRRFLGLPPGGRRRY